LQAETVLQSELRDEGRAKKQLLINQPPILTMEKLCRGKRMGGKENLADFQSEPHPVSLYLEAPDPGVSACALSISSGDMRTVFTVFCRQPKKETGCGLS
jgi:hypothetical protein